MRDCRIQFELQSPRWVWTVTHARAAVAGLRPLAMAFLGHADVPAIEMDDAGAIVIYARGSGLYSEVQPGQSALSVAE